MSARPRRVAAGTSPGSLGPTAQKLLFDPRNTIPLKQAPAGVLQQIQRYIQTFPNAPVRNPQATPENIRRLIAQRTAEQLRGQGLAQQRLARAQRAKRLDTEARQASQLSAAEIQKQRVDQLQRQAVAAQLRRQGVDITRLQQSQRGTQAPLSAADEATRGFEVIGKEGQRVATITGAGGTTVTGAQPSEVGFFQDQPSETRVTLREQLAISDAARARETQRGFRPGTPGFVSLPGIAANLNFFRQTGLVGGQDEVIGERPPSFIGPRRPVEQRSAAAQVAKFGLQTQVPLRNLATIFRDAPGAALADIRSGFENFAIRNPFAPPPEKLTAGERRFQEVTAPKIQRRQEKIGGDVFQRVLAGKIDELFDPKLARENIASAIGNVPFFSGFIKATPRPKTFTRTTVALGKGGVVQEGPVFGTPESFQRILVPGFEQRGIGKTVLREPKPARSPFTFDKAVPSVKPPTFRVTRTPLGIGATRTTTTVVKPGKQLQIVKTKQIQKAKPKTQTVKEPIDILRSKPRFTGGTKQRGRVGVSLEFERIAFPKPRPPGLGLQPRVRGIITTKPKQKITPKVTPIVVPKFREIVKPKPKLDDPVKQRQRDIFRTPLIITTPLLPTTQRPPPTIPRVPIRPFRFPFILPGGLSGRQDRRPKAAEFEFETLPPDPLRPGVILPLGVKGKRSKDPKILAQIDVDLEKARLGKDKISTALGGFGRPNKQKVKRKKKKSVLDDPLG